MREVTYPVALRGLGTEFSESTQPPEFARKLTNRFITIQGEAEKRPGTKKHSTSLGSLYSSLHEYVRQDGEVKLFAVGETTPNFESYDDDTKDWVSEALILGGALGRNATYGWNYYNSTNPYYSVQMGDKLIFVNEDNRPFYIKNVVTSGGANQFDAYELKAIVESGKTTSGTGANVLKDSSVTDWLAATFVQVNDLVHYPTLGAYAIITSVGTDELEHTAVSAGAEGWGVGGDGIGTPGTPASGIPYEIIDLVELDIVPDTTDGSSPHKDNTALLSSDGTTNYIDVSGVNMQVSELRPGDWVYNTTRAAVSRINVNITNPGIQTSGAALDATISTQTAGDSLVFLKSAMPIMSYAHVHYDRLYGIDARDKTKIRVSGPKDPQDFTTSRLTLDSSTLDYGSKQGGGDTLLSIDTFQRFLVVGGKKAVYISEGVDPIADTSADVIDLAPAGLFTQGLVSPNGFANIGEAMLYVSQDGVRQFNVSDGQFLVTNNLTEAIKTEVRNAIQSQINQGTENDIRLIHYAKRNWVMLKVGEVIYNYNYTPIYSGGQVYPGGTWSKFTGQLSAAYDYLIRNDGSMLVAEVQDGLTPLFGYTNTFDDEGQYVEDDRVGNQTVINTEYQTAWLPPDAGVRVNDGKYIKPYFESIGEQSYTIIAQSDLGTTQASAQVIVSSMGGPAVGTAVVGQDPVGGSAAAEEGKYPLRWRGEQVRISINTSSGTSRDRISKFVLYGNQYGRE